ncbi:MAG: DUF5723 family protein [Flavobacteriales bacterium]
MINSRCPARRITLLSAVASCSVSFAQTEMSVFTTTGRAAATTFVTDYQAVGINPANLGWKWRYEDKHIAFGLAEGSYSIYSEALTREDMRNRVINVDVHFTEAEKQEAGLAFANAGAALNADVMLIGACYANEKLGGFGFQVRDHAQWTSTFGPVTAQLLFEGYRSDYFDLLVLETGDTISNLPNLPPETLALIASGLASNPQLLSTVLDGSSIKFTWYREFNLSYGRRIAHNENMELFAGVGVKYLLGIGIIDVTAENNEFNGFASLSPYFDINYGDAALSNPSRVTVKNTLLPQAVGRGFGLDFGLSAVIKEKWKVGAAVTNIGSINWKGNVYTANDGALVELASDGLDNYNFFSGIDDFVTNSGILDWQGTEERRVALPTNARLGLGRLIGTFAEVGIDVVLPLNDEPGNFEKAVIGFGGDIRPLPWLQLSAGVVTGGNYDTKIPVGVTFTTPTGTFEAGVASRDIVTFFTDKNPTVSLSMGFLRFRF